MQIWRRTSTTTTALLVTGLLVLLSARCARQAVNCPSPPADVRLIGQKQSAESAVRITALARADGLGDVVETWSLANNGWVALLGVGKTASRRLVVAMEGPKRLFWTMTVDRNGQPILVDRYIGAIDGSTGIALIGHRQDSAGDCRLVVIRRDRDDGDRRFVVTTYAPSGRWPVF